MLRRLMLAAALCLSPLPAVAQTAAVHASHSFGFEGPFGQYDDASVRRGFQVYQSVCASCHSLSHLSYRHLGERGGPFEAYLEHNEETGQDEPTVAPHNMHHARRIEANDNPYVRAIAAAATISITDDTGQPAERPGRPSDRFRRPFPNDAAARASNGGALPPDLSSIVNARHGGAAYVRCLLTSYHEAPAGVTLEAGQHWNTCFAGNRIAMAAPLTSEGQVTWAEDAPPATVEQMATDVSAFLAWASDPHREARNALGLQVMAFLLVLIALLYAAYRQAWRDVKH